MKNKLFPVFIIVSLALTSSFSAKARVTNEITASTLSSIFTPATLSEALSEVLYETLNLEEVGLNRNALDYAIAGYENLLNQGLITNTQYLSIVDFSQPLNSKRFYLLDVENQELVLHTYVMHGKNSGNEIAEHFSNKINSLQSSLGFYITKYTYTGSRGYSLRLAGLENKFNSNAEARGVVVHGSNFINEERAANGKIERSEGCPAIPQAQNKKLISFIKDGSLMFIYHPSEEYLKQSTVLNPSVASINALPNSLFN
jgi:hypothetical protein